MIVLTGVRVYCWPPPLVSLSCWWTPFTRGLVELCKFGCRDAAAWGTLLVEVVSELATETVCPDRDGECRIT